MYLHMTGYASGGCSLDILVALYSSMVSYWSLSMGISNSVAKSLIATIDGQLGKHQALGPDSQPMLDDPGFLVYERVSSGTDCTA